MNTITYRSVLDILGQYFLSLLKQSEDFDTFVLDLKSEMRKLSADVLVYAIQAFDEEVRQSIPGTWKIKDRPSRTIVTLFGKITYQRTLFIDEYGRRRYLTDEILGIRKKTRISDDVFMWVAYRAAFVSYRQCAKDFFEISGALISQVSVMKIVHKEGALIERFLLDANRVQDQISQDTLFVESDGVFIALQSSTKRKQAIKRALYEKERKKTSFELKGAICYAGKYEDSSRRIKRSRVMCVCTDGDKETLFDMVKNDICSQYVKEDIERIFTASDGALHYTENTLGEHFEGVDIPHSLDPFHVMRSIRTAFPNKALASKMLGLIYSGEYEGFTSLCCYLKDNAQSESAKKRITDTLRYITNNSNYIDLDNKKLGTMEGTISHTWAKRMKNNATSWSRRGACAMGLIRSFVLFGRKLVVPDKEPFFTEAENAKKRNVIAERGSKQPVSEGEGYLPPQATFPLEKAPGVYLPVSFLSGYVR